jgi:hypothetical protein
VAVMLGKELADQSTAIREQAGGVEKQAKSFGNTGSESDIVAAIRSIDEQFRDPLSDIALQLTNPLNGARDTLIRTRTDLVASLNTLRTATAAGDERVGARIGSLNAAIRAIKIQPKITVPVYLTNNISVRNQTVKTALVSRYSPIKT